MNSIDVDATDGDLGKVKDVYFDDKHWVARYLLLDTEPWLPLSQKVLLSPIAVLQVKKDQRILTVSMSKEMVKELPKPEEHETLSREFERIYFDYLGYGYYWMGSSIWGDFTYPSPLFDKSLIAGKKVELKEEHEQTNHLRSASEIKGYHVVALDGDKGLVSDFIWDTNDWSLKYLVLDTRKWLPGGKDVLVAASCIDHISWESQAVKCNLSIEQLKACPEYEVDQLENREYIKKVEMYFTS